MNFINPCKRMNENGTFTLNGKDVEVVDECVHLGIHRDSKSRSGHFKTVDERIQSARRCAYSLMGFFLHEIESTARGLCFALHMKRTALLSQSNRTVSLR